MEKWLESVYSDGTAAFVSPPSPALNETVRIRIRMYEDALCSMCCCALSPTARSVCRRCRLPKKNTALSIMKRP